ncbi:MAG: hypothetical protein ACLUW6_03150 [Coriobacteriaceae bacterium]
MAINDDRRFCEYLSSRHDGTVIWGNGMKLAVLEEGRRRRVRRYRGPHRPRRRQFGHLPVAKKFLGIRIQLCIGPTPRTRPSSASWVSRPPSAPRPWPAAICGP